MIIKNVNKPAGLDRLRVAGSARSGQKPDREGGLDWRSLMFSYLPLGEGPGMRVYERKLFFYGAPRAASGIQRQKNPLGSKRR